MNEEVIKQMNKLIASYIEFCCKLEKQNDGLTNAFMKDDSYQEVRKLEQRGELAYNAYEYIVQVQVLSALRILWVKAVKNFQEGKFINKELF